MYAINVHAGHEALVKSVDIFGLDIIHPVVAGVCLAIGVALVLVGLYGRG